MSVALLTSPRFRQHDNLPHPESPERLVAIDRALEASGLLPATISVDPYEADDKLLQRVHDSAHIERIRQACSVGRKTALDPDTVVCPESDSVARLAIGGACAAADLVLQGKASSGLCLVRPPGHHATPDRAMGFCLYSNLALVAKWLQAERGVGKVLILDWDVHHGNGTQEIFYEDDSVFFLSTHQYPFYPGTGAAAERGNGTGEGFTMNLPFPASTEPRRILDAVAAALAEIADRFPPDFVLISAGFDGHRDDPLGGWLLEESDYRELTQMAAGIASQHCGGRLLSLLEGGYNFNALARCVVTHLQTLGES